MTKNPDAMRILVVGAGATGGYFGARLARAGRHIDFLVRPKRAAQLSAGGLHIVSPHGDVSLTPAIVTADTLAAPYDIVILGVKGFALDAALDDMAPAVGPGTMVVPLLNGMRHLDRIARRFDKSVLVGGVCRVVTTLDSQGRILQLAPPHELAYGELDGSVTDRIRRLDDSMQGAGIDARLSADIERDMWEKWTMLATLGAATCLLRGTVGEINSAPGGTATITAILDEVATTVAHVGRAPGAEVLAAIRSVLTDRTSPQTASLYRDVLAGALVETDQVIGDLVARASGVGIATPLLAAAHAQLSIYGRRTSP